MVFISESEIAIMFNTDPAMRFGETLQIRILRKAVFCFPLSLVFGRAIPDFSGNAPEPRAVSRCVKKLPYLLLPRMALISRMNRAFFDVLLHFKCLLPLFL